MKRIKRQSINLKAKAIDLQKIKANNAPNTDERNPADRGRHMQLGAAAAEPIPMHVQDVTFLLTAQKQRRQRRSSSSVLTEVDVLTAPSMGQEWSQKKREKKKQLEELAMASDWLLNSLTTLDATRLLDSGTDQATQEDADADADTNVDRHPFTIVCESGRAKLPGKLGRLHAAKV